ncbi:hypothetical protein B0H19DRAFT_1263959 [Mycena capillaripes]|nr:hypothetical protein B0H19DRAFT_1263959 [Mycena capillaripes]
MWGIYVSEAEKYDKVLVESWRDDMQGILIFAGLFSATVTGFLIESYKSLNADPGDAVVRLLTQISRQLDAMNNGTGGSVTSRLPASFAPSASSLICNTLWFISLGLSLSCALIAILLGQWARDFVHKVEMRSAPVIRGRILSYLYYGARRFCQEMNYSGRPGLRPVIKISFEISISQLSFIPQSGRLRLTRLPRIYSFNMHVVVEVVPLLIHASLFIFLVGLVAFLIPVNTIVMAVSATILVILVVVYSTFTILPITHFDCPYNTPLSAVLWSFLQWIRAFPEFNGVRTGPAVVEKTPSPPLSMLDAMTRQATANSEERAARDCRALGWTIKSLIDDDALLPFVRCIPDILVTFGTTPNPYPQYFKALIRDKDVQLSLRIEGLLRSCATGLLKDEANSKRQVACFRAMGAILMIDPTLSVIQDQALIQSAYQPQESCVYSIAELLPLVVISRYRTFLSLDAEMRDTLSYLGSCLAQVSLGRIPDLTSALVCVTKLNAAVFDYPKPGNEFEELLRHHSHSNLSSASGWINKAIKLIQALQIDTPYLLLFHYLECAAALQALPPAHWFATNVLRFSAGMPSPVVQRQYENTFNAVLGHRIPTGGFGQAQVVPAIVAHLAPFWRVTQLGNTVPSIPHPILEYLSTTEGGRLPMDYLDMVSALGREFLWSCISAGIAMVSADITLADKVDPDSTLIVTATQNLCICELNQTWADTKLLLPHYESILSAIANSPSPRVFASLTALIKFTVLRSFWRANRQHTEKAPYIAALADPGLPSGILPAETATSISEDLRADPTNDIMLHEQCERLGRILAARCGEATLNILAEFLGNYSTTAPRVACETLALLEPKLLPPYDGAIHIKHQLRLADSIQLLFGAEDADGNVHVLRRAVIQLPMFRVPPQLTDSEDPYSGLLDDSVARSRINEAFATYATFRRNNPERTMLPFGMAPSWGMRMVLPKDNSETSDHSPGVPMAPYPPFEYSRPPSS